MNKDKLLEHIQYALQDIKSFESSDKEDYEIRNFISNIQILSSLITLLDYTTLEPDLLNLIRSL